MGGVSGRAIAPLLSVIVAGLLGCNASAPPSPSSVSGAPSSTPTAAIVSAAPLPPSEPVVPTEPVSFATPTVFSSERYGYVVSLPAPWTLSYRASTTWDGIGSASHEGPYVDQFTAPRVVAWAVAAPTALTLTAYATHTLEASAVEHGCPKMPDADDPISLGGDHARLLTIHCPILVLIAVTIHNGSALTFAMQSPFGHRSTDDADRALFLTLLGGIRFTS